MKRTAILVIGLLCSMTPASVHAIDDAGTPDPPAGDATPAASLATYGDRTIDLRESWAGAEACYVQSSGTTCFDTERQMDEFIAATQPTEPTGWSGLRSSALRTTCSSTLRLYDGISYGLPVLGIGIRFVTTNLSAFGFDNLTTSYRVGACAALLYQGVSGSGAVYPGNTSANASSPNMVTGWNNTISSVYLS